MPKARPPIPGLPVTRGVREEMVTGTRTSQRGTLHESRVSPDSAFGGSSGEVRHPGRGGPPRPARPQGGAGRIVLEIVKDGRLQRSICGVGQRVGRYGATVPEGGEAERPHDWWKDLGGQSPGGQSPRDNDMLSKARFEFRWVDEFTLSLDPEQAQEYYSETLPGEGRQAGHSCSVCGPRFCTVQITYELRAYARDAGSPWRKRWG